jgi:hypothetical protein
MVPPDNTEKTSCAKRRHLKPAGSPGFSRELSTVTDPLLAFLQHPQIETCVMSVTDMQTRKVDKESKGKIARGRSAKGVTCHPSRPRVPSAPVAAGFIC